MIAINASPLPRELFRAGLQNLAAARTTHMAAISLELNNTLPAWEVSRETNKPVEGIPEWVRALCTAPIQPDGSASWREVEIHLTRRTKHLIAATELAEGVTGGSLALFLGVDLETFAGEGWANIEQHAPIPAHPLANAGSE